MPAGREANAVLAQPKRFALLAYLAAATPYGFHRRDTILGLFWPEADQEHARTALRKATHFLRQELGRGLIVSRGDEELGVPESGIWCDVREFEQALTGGLLGEALALYRGDLLPGLFVSETPEFERWLEEERARLRARAVVAAWSLAGRLEREGEVYGAERWARWACALRADDECELQRLIALLGRLGDRAGARRAYEEFAERLRRDYDLAPCSETKAVLAMAVGRPDAALGQVVSSNPPSSTAVGEPPGFESLPSRSSSRHAGFSRARLKVSAIIGAALIIGGLGFAAVDTGKGKAAGVPKRVAVLPFENLGPRENEYFADGVTDAVRGKLAALPGLQVIARSSSSQYKRTTKSPQQIGQELGVQYLLTGTVRWSEGASGRRVQVSPELIQVATAAEQWQQPFDAVPSDVFEVQADIAAQVAQALRVALGAGERRMLSERPTANVSAYAAFLRGNQLWYGASDLAEERRALEQYERAVTLDSTFALAWAAVSRVHSVLYDDVSAGRESERRAAYLAAQRAVSIDPALPEGHLALLRYYGYTRYDWPRALAEFSQARENAPGNAEVLRMGAVVEGHRGRLDQALSHLREAERLDPRSSALPETMAFYLFYHRRYSQALTAADRALALAIVGDPGPVWDKVVTHLAEGDVKSARAVLDTARSDPVATVIKAFTGGPWGLPWVLDENQQGLILRLAPTAFDDDTVAWGLALAATHALRRNGARARAYADSARTTAEARLKVSPEDPPLHVYLGLAYAYEGRVVEAIREGQEAVARMPFRRDAIWAPYLQHQLARIYLLVGQPEKALDQLEALLRIPYYLSPAWLKIDPTFAPLRGNPRFERLVAGS
jgi:TolB-like protein/DNA-binding SARP family transcriptional activator